MRTSARQQNFIDRTTSPLPWALTLTAVIALAAFGTFRREGFFAAVIGIAFFAPNALSLRFGGRAGKLLVRLCMYAIAAAASMAEHEPIGGQTVYGDVIQVVSRFFLAELAAQNWIAAASGERFSRHASIVLLSCAIMAAASKTFDVNGIFIYFALPFFILLSLNFRQLRDRSGARVQPQFAVRAWTHWLALLIALGIGVSFSGTVQANKRALAQLGLGGIVSPVATAPPVVSYSSAPVLGERQNVTRSTQRVMRVEGEVPDGGHLRGMSFDLYNLGRWEPSGDIRTFQVYRVPTTAPAPGSSSCTITRLTDDIPLLFLPLNTVSLSLPADASVQRDGVYLDVFQTYFAAPFQYTAFFGAQNKGLLSRAPGGTFEQRLLWTPPNIDPKVFWLAKEITGKVNDPLEKIRAVEKYLRSTHEYSLEIKPGPGDPVSDFIINKRAGHCEFFASAAALLLRNAGIPTRYVTGFYVHEREDNGWIVRQQDAHAWAESYVPGKGWVTVEATPEAGLPINSGDKLSIWRRWLERLTDIGQGLWAKIKTWGAVQWSLVGAALLSITFLIYALRRWGLRRAPSAMREYVIPGKYLPEAAKQMELRLSRLSVPCPPHLTWEEHLGELLSRANPPASRKELEAAAAFAKRYAALRFGAPEDEARCRELVS